MTLGAEYRRLWVGSTASNLADGITFVALPLLAATVTDDPLAVAGLSVAYSAPRVASVLGVGVLVDRAGRRGLLHAANLSRGIALAALALALLVLAGSPSLVALYAVAAVMGLAETLSDSAAFAVLPQVVPADRLDRANARLAGTQTVVDEFVGPPLGGLLFATAAFAPSAVAAAAFLAAGLAYRRLRGTYAPADPAAGRAGVLASVREGAVWTARHPVLRLLVAVGALASVAYMIPFSSLVLYASDELGLDGTGYGLLLSFSALGGLVGSALASRLRRLLGYGWAIVAALSLGAVSFLVISTTTQVVVVAVALAAYIAHAVVWNVLAASVRQRATPASMMGRAASVSRLLSLLGLTAGAVAGGLLASELGFRASFAVAGGLFAVAAVLCALATGTLRRWEASEPG